MSFTQKQSPSNKSKPQNLSSLSSSTSNHGVVTRSVPNAQHVLSTSPRKTSIIKTTQNLVPDESGTHAGNQLHLPNTTVALATNISDVSLDSDFSTLQDLGADSSIAQVTNSGDPFSGWSKGSLFQLLTEACRDFRISIWLDEEEVAIKEFAKKHFMNVESAAELRLRTVSMKREHERYKDLAKQLLMDCVEMNKLSKDWWKEAKKHNQQETDEIKEDDKRYWEHIKPNLIQEECNLSVIGDTGAGALKTTSGICEICYSTTKRFSKKPKNSSTFEDVKLDFCLPSTTLSSALAKYVANQTAKCQDSSSGLYRLEWPVEILNSKIIVYDTPGFNDCPELTDVVTEHMKKSLVFLIVINCGLTDSLLKSLNQLKKLGASGKTIFCVVTHLDDKTMDQQNKALDDVKNGMLNLFSEFNTKNCVMLNPEKALHILKTYEVYGIDHFKFLQVFIPFLSQIFTLKAAELTTQIHSMLQRLKQFVQICYNFCDDEFRKSYKVKIEIQDRQSDFKEAKERLKAKINTITEDFNNEAAQEIVRKFSDADFKRQFMEVAESTVFPDDIMAAANWDAKEKNMSDKLNGKEYGFDSFLEPIEYKQKVIDEYELSFISAVRVYFGTKYATSIVTTDVFKVYLQVQLVQWIDQQLTMLLSEIAEQTMEIVYQICSNDLKTVNDALKRRYQLLTQKTVHDPNTKQKFSSILTPMITNHEKNFSGHIKVLIGIGTLGLILVGEKVYDMIKGYTEKQIRDDPKKFNREVAERLYKRISDKVNNQDELINKLGEDRSLFLGDVLAHFERALIDINQLSEIQQACKNTEEWRSVCSTYLTKYDHLQLKIFNFQVKNLLQWSLKANQLEIDEQSVVRKSVFDGSIIKYGSLKMNESGTLTPRVSIRSLHYEFNILHVCRETHANRLINYDNLLYCYGAYLSENIVHIVTGPYTETLDDFLCSNTQLKTRNILQMSLQLTEVVDFVLQKIEKDEMYDSLVLNTNSVMVTTALQIKLNVVANKVDFLYQPPEDLFPRYVKMTPDASVSKLFSSIYSLGLIYYRLCYRKPEEIHYFKSGKWLLSPQEEDEKQQGTITTVELKDYTNFVEIYHEDQHFQFRTPIINQDSATISIPLQDLIKYCYSIDFMERPALNVSLSVLRYLLFMQDNTVNSNLEVRVMMKNPLPSSHLKYGLLSIDGGGTKGIIPAAIIEFLEQKSGKNFWELFDLTAGCSTGGILVLASMLRRAEGTQLVALYKSLAKEVFSFQRWLPTTEYSVTSLENILKREFGDMKMNPQITNPKTFVVTKRDTETKPFLLRNYNIPSSKHEGDFGWKCSEAVRATSAAPTYFKPFRKDNHSYTDGGVGFNNPVELLYDEAFALLSLDSNKNSFAVNECPIAYIVSLGTGKIPNLPVTDSNAFSVIRVKNDIESIVEQASDTENAHHRIENICQRLNIPYYRFNPELKERAALTKTASLTDWYKQTKDYMNLNSERVNELCALFSEKTCSIPSQSCNFISKK